MHVRQEGDPVPARASALLGWVVREGATNVIEVHINRLRKKLDGDGAASIIHTVRGRGYALRAN